MTGKSRSRSLTVSKLREVGIIPVIRAPSADAAVAVVEALLEAGLPVAEITMTVRNAIDAGASFIVSPCFVPEVIDAAHRADVPVLPGALTPGEVFEAFRLGGDMVKVFPAQSVGGAAYLRALRGPFPDILLVPTGGVTLENVAEMFKAATRARFSARFNADARASHLCLLPSYSRCAAFLARKRWGDIPAFRLKSREKCA